MRRRSVSVVATVVLVALVAFSIFLATRHVAPEAGQINSPLLGHRAPDFTATTLSGSRLSLRQERGSLVVLNFWASWCGPCQQEAPELQTFAWQERNDRVAVLGVDWQDTESAALAFQSTYGKLYPSVIDAGGTIANAYGVTAPPTTFIISTTGTVLATLVGATTAAQLTSVVNRVRRS